MSKKPGDSKEKKSKNVFRYIVKSEFLRSVFIRVLAVFIIVSVAITAIAFYSFASEIRKNALSDRKKQLTSIENTISDRMNEVMSIAYNIGVDSAFYTEPVEGRGFSGKEMSDTLKRYLVGNGFIENLAYYRLSEPDKIYVSSGERSLTEFFMSSMGLSSEATEQTINGIQNSKEIDVRAVSYGEGKPSYFTVLYPLPQMVQNPTAFVLMMIPQSEIEPLLEPILSDSRGGIAVFDADGNEIIRKGELPEAVDMSDYVESSDSENREYKTDNGTKYTMQKVTSDDNSWTYVSVIQNADTLPGLANKLLVFIVLLLLLMLFAVVSMTAFIIMQYKPINTLAAAVAGQSEQGGNKGGTIDERVLLSNTIATLTDDSLQKQKYKTAYLEAESANKAKSVFLSNMSHDIRTPMNAVIGMTAIALRHTEDPEYVKDCLQKVQVSSQYLLDVINNVLDMSRIESGRLTLKEESVDLAALADNLAALVQPTVDTKSQRLVMNIDKSENRRVVGDSVRLTQVFVNILSNAVKFTPEGGKISFVMTKNHGTDEAEDSAQYTFTVTDTGIGMSQDFVYQVFETFTRAKNADDTKTEGTGLGMSIAKNLVELMGGTIVCESTLGEGTTFTVTLPMKYAENGAEADESGTAMKKDDFGKIPLLKGKHLLLVEDNAINREIAHQILDETGADVVEAGDGQEALTTFAESPEGYFDFILMDLQMPRMNGYEATAQIRSLERADAENVPIYAMTANTFDEDVRRVLNAGMNGHIGKPYTPETLYKILNDVLGE